MLVHRHGLVEETKSLIKLMTTPVSYPLTSGLYLPMNVGRLMLIPDLQPYVTPLSKSVIDETDAHFAGLYCGVISTSPEVQARAEEHDLIFHLGPYPTSTNTGGLSSRLPVEKVVKLHPKYCSRGSKLWDNIHFKPVLEKLLLEFSRNPPRTRANPSPSFPQTINVGHS